MRKLLLLVMLLPGLFSCKKDKTERVVTTYEIVQHPVWVAESFKTNYTIQFPPEFVGMMIPAFEGNMLDKRRIDATRYFYYYSDNLRWHDFRDTLFNVLQPSVQAVFFGTPMTLSERIEFTSQGQLQGVLYHNNLDVSSGRLFWKDGGFFKETMDLRFWKANLGETINIVRSIKRK